MARFKGRKESKTPVMRPNTIRRRGGDGGADAGPVEESDEAIEDALLAGVDAVSTNCVPPAQVDAPITVSETDSSEVDSRADCDRSVQNTTVIERRVVPRPMTEPVVPNDAVVPMTLKVKPSKATTKSPVSSTAPIGGETSTTAVAMDTDGDDVGHAKGQKAAAKGANDSRDSGHGDDVVDEGPGLYASVSMIEEQTRSNFPKTARPPGLVDCSTVSIVG